MIRQTQPSALVAEEVHGLGDVPGPATGVADLSAAQGHEVVHVVRNVLRQAEGALGGKVEVHLGRALGTRRQLEQGSRTPSMIFSWTVRVIIDGRRAMSRR